MFKKLVDKFNKWKGTVMVHCSLCKEKFKSKAILNAHLTDAHGLTQLAPATATKADYDRVWLMNEDLKMENERLLGETILLKGIIDKQVQAMKDIQAQSVVIEQQMDIIRKNLGLK